MSQIIKAMIAESSLLTIEARKIAQARLSPCLRDLSPENLRKLVSGLLMEAATRLGQKQLSEEIAKVAVLDLERVIREDFAFWTTEEISMALREGALGNLGTREEVALSSRVVISWIKAFANGPRKEAIFEINRMRDKMEAEKAAQLKEAAEFESYPSAIDFFFEVFRTSNKIYTCAHVWGVKLGLFKKTNEERWALVDEAVARIKTTSLKSNNLAERREAQAMIERVVPGDLSSLHGRIVNICREIELTSFYRQCLRDNTLPSVVIENLKKSNP